jgi:hypothetical protein
MSAERNQLESYWEFAFQDLLLDVAAAVAATEAQSVVFQEQPPVTQPALSLRWAVCEKVGEPV